MCGEFDSRGFLRGGPPRGVFGGAEGVGGLVRGGRVDVGLWRWGQGKGFPPVLRYTVVMTVELSLQLLYWHPGRSRHAELVFLFISNNSQLLHLCSFLQSFSYPLESAANLCPEIRRG